MELKFKLLKYFELIISQLFLIFFYDENVNFPFHSTQNGNLTSKREVFLENILITLLTNIYFEEISRYIEDQLFWVAANIAAILSMNSSNSSLIM